jgi:predicted dehydrogenase
MDLARAAELVELAERRGLILGSAPCSLLGRTAQTIWHGIRSGVIGRPVLAYAELDDGAIHQMPYQSWISASGARWPYADEARVGPVLEHSAYHLSWLTAFFGPAVEVTSFAELVYPGKLDGAGIPAPDFACACIRFRSGVVARLTCGTVAPENHALHIVGDEGVLSVRDCWDVDAEISVRTRVTSPESAHHYLSDNQRYSLIDTVVPQRVGYHDTHNMDFARGVEDIADAVRRGGNPVMHARHSFHVLEIVLAIARGPARTNITSTFGDLEPISQVILRFGARTPTS